MSDEERLSFMGHLDELRKRLIHCCIAVGIGFGICYYFSEDLFLLLFAPLKAAMPAGGKMIFTNVIEPFMTYIKIGLIGGILLSSPYLFFQFWRFVAPGLYQNEKKLVFPFVFFSTVLFVGGAVFGYTLVFPAAFQFLASYANENIMMLPTMREYFSISIHLLLAFGICFELPIVIFFLAKIGVVTTVFLKRKRKYFIVVAFIAAAIITPTPDPITQTLLAVPLILLYEVGVLLARGVEKRKAKNAQVSIAPEDSCS